MDEFIEKLNAFLKRNQVSKKRTLGNIPILDNNGNYLIESKDKISKLIKPNFLNRKHHLVASNNIDYLRNKLFNQYIMLQNNYYSNYPLEDIKLDQQKLKDNIKLIDQIKNEEQIFERELSDVTKEIIFFEKELIKLYYTINFGEKKQIKKYLELKMKLDGMRKKEKLLKERGVKRVTIQDFKISELETLKIEYLNIKKTILSTNIKKAIIPSKKTISKSIEPLKRTQKKTMEGGDYKKNSILKKKGSMKNTKNISWESSLSDGTEIIDNSYNDFSDLENTTDIDLSSISKDMNEYKSDIDLSDLNIVDAHNVSQQGGEINTSSFQSLELDSLTDSPSQIINTIDTHVDNLNIRDTNILLQNNDIKDSNDIINLESKKTNELITDNHSNDHLGVFSNSCANINNLSSMSIDNSTTDKASSCFPDPLVEQASPAEFVVSDSQILQDVPKLVGGGEMIDSSNKPLINNNLDTPEKSLDMDKIMVSIGNDNDINIISEPLDTINEPINNSDIKIINLK